MTNIYLTNRRKLALQFLDSDARAVMRAALYAHQVRIEQELASEAQRKALDKLKKASAFDGGAWLRAQQDKALRAVAGLLEALN